ncbi:cysteine desulfurase family protein [Candidatus Thiothrix sp. Deng01]|uniref:cysteine desulfurase n=1 Tax=Candidatus Thiothrix phosphatis TaxID=3112415 RepID=A0ABU6D5H8_9GAMM|nr:cysteine desulfurase family protein [Candidatus Thiothrix sp. Deng01]MEB4593554.1 cysteine desulfurase family protein [Candidatus Thiothrix sp. Deng01]
MNKQPLYLDAASTTPVAPEAIAAMLCYLGSSGCYYNPSSTNHLPGQEAAASVDTFRTAIATAIGCEPEEVVFTSGATEANNLALRGIAHTHASQGKHIITSLIEHKSVLETCRSLEREGFTLTYLRPDSGGTINPDAVKNALRPDTLLVSLLHTNNETGVIQPVGEIASLLADAGVLFHVDAAQAVGKLPLNLSETPIDLLSLSAHKFHGPKGVGCLVIRNRRHLRLEPLLTGGGQEFGLRSGTLATHQIAGMSVALQLATKHQAQDHSHVSTLNRLFIEQLEQNFAIKIHGDRERSSPYIVNFSIYGISSDALINQLATEVALSSGSACASGTVDPSYVLRAMGIEGDALYGAVRASFSRYHTMADISLAVERIVAAVRRMQELD